MENIRIITINTWKCDGNYDKRLKLMADQLKALSPAIIACQECFQSDEAGADTLTYLAESLEMQALFLPARFRKRIVRGNWANSFSGLGLLSKYPLTPLENHILPEVPGDDERKLQLVVVQLPAGENLLVANCHLTHLRNTERRKQQAIFVAEKVTALNSCKYRVICGDMNAFPGSAEIRALLARSGAIDAYATGEGREPRYSLAEAYDRGLSLCVDYVMALPFPGSENHPQFVNSSIVLNHKDKESGIYPSDHFGMSTTLVI